MVLGLINSSIDFLNRLADKLDILIYLVLLIDELPQFQSKSRNKFLLWYEALCFWAVFCDERG